MHKCIYCNKELCNGKNILEIFTSSDILCGNCRNKFNVINKVIDFHGYKVHVLYEYTKYLESIFFQYKECGDYELRNIFICRFIKEIEYKYKDYILVFCPSHLDKTNIRGFHALKEIFANINLEKLECLSKIDNVKQSNLNREQRINNRKNYTINSDILNKDMNILLVDDVGTSGNTISTCYELILPYVNDIKVLLVSAVIKKT